MTATRAYTKHGLRAHYVTHWPPQPLRAQTLCGHEAYLLSERSRFWRRRLAQASVCAVCEKAEEQA